MTAIVAVANLKGGSTKTTTVAMVAQVMAGAGLSVMCVDSDPQQSLMRWAELASWDFTTVGLATKMAHRQLPDITAGKDVALVDTPPLEESAGIVASVIRAADVVVVPCAPTPMEIERMATVRALIDDTAALRPSGDPPRSLALLTRTVPRAASTSEWRKFLVDDGWNVATENIRRRENIAQSFGNAITADIVEMFAPIVDEILTLALEKNPS